jgi:hypothetical protein
MEEFQDILLGRIQDRLYSLKWPPKPRKLGNEISKLHQQQNDKLANLHQQTDDKIANLHQQKDDKIENLHQQKHDITTKLHQQQDDKITDLNSKNNFQIVELHQKKDDHIIKLHQQPDDQINKLNQNKGFMSKAANLFKATGIFFKKKAENFLKTVVKFLKKARGLSNSSELDVSPELKKLNWDLREKISQFVWDEHVGKLKSIIHDIPVIITVGPNFWKEYKTSSRLKLHVLQTIDYMYNQKMITHDAFGEFLKSEETLQVAAYNRVFFSEFQEGFNYEIRLHSKAIPILNEWHSQMDRRLFSGKLK